MTTLAVLYYLAAAAAVVVLIVRTARTRSGIGGPVHDRHEAAFLNGGPARVVDAAIAALQADGRIAVGGPGIVSVLRPTAHDHVERALLHEHAGAPHGALHHLRLVTMRHPAVQEIGDGLAARGLIVTPPVRRSAIRWSVSVGIGCLAMVPLTLILTVFQMAGPDDSGLSVPFFLIVLPALIGAGVTAAVCGAIAARRITPAGLGAVAAYGRDHGHLADAGHLVALFGLRALPDPMLREQLLTAARIRVPRPSGGGARRAHRSHSSSTDSYAALVTVWCAAGAGGESGGGGCGAGGGGGAGCSGGSCSGGGGGGGGSCSGSSGSSCSSSSSGGSSCSSSSGSSCGGGSSG
ncbi:TIGR04222 domain-containing membrane protein [Streptomyces sp. NPDC053755]|uniref:TIGR04222 domain-containing membrane protein n=1 Tax=Streptomyces sp. NPDC053755 TaxID=3155815 RepID=UPI0034417E5E